MVSFKVGLFRARKYNWTMIRKWVKKITYDKKVIKRKGSLNERTVLMNIYVISLYHQYVQMFYDKHFQISKNVFCCRKRPNFDFQMLHTAAHVAQA